MHDIIVIGAGPAGLTAALYALRANKSVLVLEKSSFGGQMTFSPKIENYPGFAAVSGNELADKLVEQVLAQGADVELEEVEAIEASGKIKRVITDSGEHECRSIIVATGAKHRLLGVPGEDKFIGDGISFCAVCDGAFYNGKRVAVIGGGNSALQEAALLSEQCESVTMIQNLDYMTGEKRLVEALESKPNVSFILGTVVKEFIGDEELSGVITERVSDKTTQTLSFDGVFVAIGLAPENGIVEKWTRLDHGYIASDERCLTDTEGVFAAGDCRTKSVRQITTATADGATAALAACAYIDSAEQ